MEIYDEVIGARACRVFGEGTGGAVLFFANDLDEAGDIAALTRDMSEGAPFTLVAFSADWDGELTPWRAEGVLKNRVFAGGGDATLRWLTDCALPRFPAEKRYIGGYSLGGLFALWAYFECRAFDGAASASGSLWYPGWREYAENASLRRGGRIYLSLGDREERTRHPVMAQVGENTRAFAQKCADFGMEYTMVWNEGNHFNHPEARTAAAFSWLLRA